MVLANPFRFETAALTELLAQTYPAATIIGGLVPPDTESRMSALLLNADAYDDGAILLGLGGPYALFPLLSHGTDPLGEPWTITSVQGESIETIGNRPALQLIDKTLRRIPADLRDRTRSNLLVGFAIDEYRLISSAPISSFARLPVLIRPRAQSRPDTIQRLARPCSSSCGMRRQAISI